MLLTRNVLPAEFGFLVLTSRGEFDDDSESESLLDLLAKLNVTIALTFDFKRKRGILIHELLKADL